MIINNLRMATKYSFHVRKQTKKSEQKSARADFSDNRIDLIHGQTIILPTKGCMYIGTMQLSYCPLETIDQFHISFCIYWIYSFCARNEMFATCIGNRSRNWSIFRWSHRVWRRYRLWRRRGSVEREGSLCDAYRSREMWQQSKSWYIDSGNIHYRAGEPGNFHA